MSNPFNILNPNNAMNVNNIARIRSAYQASRNPMQLFQQMAQNNPRLQPIMNMLRNGANPQQLFTSMCNERGINAQEFINQITRI